MGQLICLFIIAYYTNLLGQNSRPFVPNEKQGDIVDVSNNIEAQFPFLIEFWNFVLTYNSFLKSLVIEQKFDYPSK